MKFLLFLLSSIGFAQGVILSMEPSSPALRLKKRLCVELVPVQVSCRYCEASGISHMFSSSEEEHQHIWEDHGIIAGERVFQEYRLPKVVIRQRSDHDEYSDDAQEDQDDNNQDEPSPQPVRKGKRSYQDMSSSSSHDEE